MNGTESKISIVLWILDKIDFTPKFLSDIKKNWEVPYIDKGNNSFRGYCNCKDKNQTSAHLFVKQALLATEA